MAKNTKKPVIIQAIETWQRNEYKRADLVKDLNTLRQFFADVRESDGECITLKELRESEAAIQRIMLIHNCAYQMMEAYHHPSVWSDLVDLEFQDKAIPYLPWYIEKLFQENDL